MNTDCDLICAGMALVDSIIKGFDPKPISASGYRATSGSLNVGGEAVLDSILFNYSTFCGILSILIFYKINIK